MAKQTFTTGSVLTATQMNNLQANDYNWTVSQKTASYVLVAADAGTRIEMNAAGSTTVTVNTGLFTAGDSVIIQNIGAGTCTVTAGTAIVNKATNASLALAQYQGGTLYFVSASSAIFFPFDVGAVTASASGCAVYKNTAQTLANTTMTEITWELEYFDTNSYHSTVSNTGRLSVPQAGMYFVGASITMASATVAGREMRIRRYNSSNVVQEYRYQESDFTINGNSCQTLSGIFQASAGDYFTIEQYQASGGNLDTSSFAGNVTAYIYYIGA